MQTPFYCAAVERECWQSLPEGVPLHLRAGDFVLVPETCTFSMFGPDTLPSDAPVLRVMTAPGTFRPGRPEDVTTVCVLVGHCRFRTTDKTLLVSLLPAVLHVCVMGRLTALVQMIHDELQANRPVREMVLHRLLEVLLIDALRTRPHAAVPPPGLLRRLADPRFATALRRIHAGREDRLSVPDLARDAGLPRSVFFQRFRREVGMAPMEYVTARRMAWAKDMLLQGGLKNAEIVRPRGLRLGQRLQHGLFPAYGPAARAFAQAGGEVPAAADMAESTIKNVEPSRFILSRAARQAKVATSYWLWKSFLYLRPAGSACGLCHDKITHAPWFPWWRRRRQPLRMWSLSTHSVLFACELVIINVEANCRSQTFVKKLEARVGVERCPSSPRRLRHIAR